LRPCARRREGTNTADILYLIDRLEDILNAGWRVPLTNKAVIDHQALLDAIDQMRVATPEEIKLSKRMTQDKERFVSQAQTEAERIIATAQEQAARMLQGTELTKSAESRAQAIIDESRREAARIKSDADAYAMGVLTDLVGLLGKQQHTAQNGIESLKKRLAS